MRRALTDKSGGRRTAKNQLPEEPRARLIVPGYKDPQYQQGVWQAAAPTGARTSQHLLFRLNRREQDLGAGPVQTSQRRFSKENCIFPHGSMLELLSLDQGST